MSHKGKMVSSYTLKYKLEALAFVENSSINSASKKFNVESCFRWKRNMAVLNERD